MSLRPGRALGVALVVGAAALLFVARAPARALPEQAASQVVNPGFVRGVALGLFATDPDWDYGPLVDEIAARGATDVLVVVNGYQSDRFASDVALAPGRSPSLANVARTLTQVHARGMRAALMPVVRLGVRGPGDWRGVITPADGVDAWFAAYRRFLLPLAEIAQRAQATRFVVGSELNSLEVEQAAWRALIAQVRTRFSGALLYSANWDHAAEVGFWDALDQVGITGYFPLASDGERPTRASLEAAWRGPQAQLQALSAHVGKPVLLTELGYPSQSEAARRPWDDTRSGEPDLQLQARLYGSFCQAFDGARYLSGVYVWNWFGFGGPRDAGYSPRGKPAAATLAACFARPWHAPLATPAEGAAL